MTAIQLSPAQQAILAHAAEHTGGKIDRWPAKVQGGARKKMLEGMFKRGLITPEGTDWFLAPEGYDALGRERPAPQLPQAAPQMKAAAMGEDSAAASERTQAEPRTRENSKQALVIAMLRRPEGATISQICEATGWQAHTVRGTFAGTVKKKLGLVITSTKVAGEQRVYRAA